MLTQKQKINLFCAISLINGAMYFFIAASGGENLKKLFDIDDAYLKTIVYTLGFPSCACYGAFYYMSLQTLDLKPKTVSAKFLCLLAPFAASTFLAGAIIGATWLGANPTAASLLGISVFLPRAISMIDTSVKFPNNIKKIKSAWSKAKNNRKEQLRLLTTLYGTLSFTASSTDPIYSATVYLATWALGIDKNNFSLSVVSYFFCALGALGTLPLTLCLEHKGIKQLTYGGEMDENGISQDPTDKYTFYAFISILPVILGVLGALTPGEGKVFARLGLFADVVRTSSAVMYALSAGVIGLALVYRNIAKTCSERKNNRKIYITPAEMTGSTGLTISIQQSS